MFFLESMLRKPRGLLSKSDVRETSSMRECENCGSALSDAGPFGICPKCLFQMALNRQEHHSKGSSTDSKPISVGSRLSTRHDFLEKYEILERVAQGGQGDLWKVWDFELRRCVAMKRLGNNALASDAAKYRFLAEAQIAGQLEHPGILPIFDVGLDPDDRPFYTTQLLPGTTLGDIWLKVGDSNNGEWTRNRALELLVRVCDVMAHAHNRGVIHRDLKPSNVLVGSFGDVRVIDWGSARILDRALKDFQEPFVQLNQAKIETDRTEAIQGQPASPLATAKAGQPITALFMPPEILRGQVDQLGPQTDVYSVGVMLYELLAGHPPFANRDGSLPDPTVLRERILESSPTPLRKLNRAISRDLAAICQKAMTPVRNERYGSMQELGDDLRAALEVRPVSARHPGLLLRLQKWAQRNVAPVLLASLALLIAAVSFAVLRGFRAERDLARQLTAIRSAELAARGGNWRLALRHWEDAEVAGFSDSIYLGLRRAEAWTILTSARRSRAELDKLVRRPDLHDRLGVVLLRIGEHELFDAVDADRGIQHVREALAAGLTGADRLLAQGLLAESTPEALEHFRQALRFDPYHHSAHRHSLGLEYLLGRHQELENHIRVFKAFFPDDPSAGFLEAAELAGQCRLSDAEAALSKLAGSSDPDLRKQLGAGLRVVADLTERYRLEHLLEKGPVDSNANNPLAEALLALPLPSVLTAKKAPSMSRVPQLPCLRYFRDGYMAAGALALPLFSDPAPSVQKITVCWQKHPEALLPFYGATLLEGWHPRSGSRSSAILSLQAALYQLAADSPSVLPTLGRRARYLVAVAQAELARSSQTNAAAARQDCLDNIRRAAASSEASAEECRAYFKLAFQLGDHDLARALLNQEERLGAKGSSDPRSRVQLELAAGAPGNALRLLNEVLRDKPQDAWALEQKSITVARLKELLESATPKPAP